MKNVRLGDIATIYNGNSINKNIKTEKYTKNVPGWNYVGTKDVDFDGSINYNTGVVIPYAETGFRVAPKGTVFVCSEGGSAGKKTALVKEDVCFGNKLFAIVNEKGLFDEKYIFFYTRYAKFSEQFKLLATSLMGGISAKNFSAIEIPLVSVKEQKRIVNKIEELFSELDSAVETLKRTKEQLAVYRQSVLKDAFSRFSSKEIILNHSELVTSGSRGWAQYYSEQGARFIRITDLTRDRIVLKNDDVQYVALPNNVEGKRSRLMANDILVSITADLGSIALVPEDIEEAYINQHIALVRLKNPDVAKFIALYLKSDWGQKDLLRNKRGGGKLGLGLDDIRNTPIPIVSNDIACKVVSQIESRLTVCDNIEKTVNDALAQAEAMRQSILKKAFEGSL